MVESAPEDPQRASRAAVTWEGSTLHVRGTMDFAFAAVLEREIDHTTQDVDLDLSEAIYIENMVLGTIITWHRHLAQHGSRLRLVKPSSSVRRALELHRLVDVLHVVDPG